MRCGPLLLAIGAGGAACSASSSPSDGDVPLTIPMDIVVSDGTVQVYMHALDHRGCTCKAFTFPAVGTCSFVTDANPCDENPNCTSCITNFAVEVDGVPLTPTGLAGNDPWQRSYDPFPSGQLSLVIGGCGHPTTRIALDGAAFPAVTASADYVGGVPHVSWTADAPSISTLLTLSSSTHGDVCHMQGASEYSFTDWMYGSTVRVQPIVSRVDLDTDFGPATLWRAGSKFATFPNP